MTDRTHSHDRPAKSTDYTTDAARTTDAVEPGDIPELSVVVIAKNEADRIATCLESVFRAADGVAPFEVILVDSASTDETVDIARQYPVTVLRIPAEHVVSCGAGRYVGDQVARGDVVLHVDGDMKLTEDWLGHAVSYLREHDVAGVEGWLNESNATEPMVVDKLGGVMLYDRDALESIGGWAPYLQSYEDIDVGYRLTAAGYRLVRLPHVSAVHPLGDPISEPFRRWRAGYYHGVGQAIRYASDSPRVLLRLLRRQHYKAALVAWATLGVLSLATGFGIFAWLAASTLGFAIVARKLGVREAVQFLLTKSFGVVGATVGLFDPAAPQSTYPLEEIEVVDAGPVPEAQADFA
ncbi:glycosyltransferase [Halorubellus sp. JP-L1]|uniref:glycosyltransferase n=1 Tax=Halorubellus sp. JP-L1 TaxID=2715753 RepID=UPI00140994CA|nr:glycosyltransferase [Halorubellus sp. JP-L1]NHN43180.1 glycosyltransferase [Halorubellus sp. JP-L1]